MSSTAMQRIEVNVEMVASRPVGGVLSARYGRGDHPSKRPTRGLPRKGLDGQPMSSVWPCSKWGLPSRPGHPDRWCALTAPFHPCLCPAENRTIGGLLSVALSFGSPRLAVSQHFALWSPDLPQRDIATSAQPAAVTRPARHGVIIALIVPCRRLHCCRGHLHITFRSCQRIHHP